MKKLIAIFSLVFPFTGMGLQIDEKLTLRVLDVSDTKRTVLINRGLEDGLVVGDHAKFYLTTGVIARAVAVKASPGRSIWTVYRVIDSSHLAKDKVMNLKIASAVKLTKDPTKSINPDESISVVTKSIPLADGADDIAKILAASQRKELQNVQGHVSGFKHQGVFKKDWEVWGQVHLNGLSYRADIENGSSEGVHTTFGASAGLERYFDGEFDLVKRISLFGMIHYHSLQTGNLKGDSIGVRGIEYGGGVNYHLNDNPMSYGMVIPFATVGFGIGSMEELTTRVTQNESEDTTVAGTSAFFLFGVGAKYYLANGFGMRLFLDYYSRSESYTVEDSDISEDKTSEGPRIMVGLSYRW